MEDALKTINSFLKPLHFYMAWELHQRNQLYIYDIDGYILGIGNSNGYLNAYPSVHSIISNIDSAIKFLSDIKTFRHWNPETHDWNNTEMPNPYFGCNSLEKMLIKRDLIDA